MVSLGIIAARLQGTAARAFLDAGLRLYDSLPS